MEGDVLHFGDMWMAGNKKPLRLQQLYVLRD